METTPQSFYPENRPTPLPSRVHLAFTQLDADLTDPVRGPHILNVVKTTGGSLGNFVDKLRKDNQHDYEALLNNQFCAVMAKGGDEKINDANYKWYMVQDMVYLRQLVVWRLGQFANAPWDWIKDTTRLDDFRVRLGKDVRNANDQETACTQLGITNDQIAAAANNPGDVIKEYVQYMISTTEKYNARHEDWISIHVTLVACLISYYDIAEHLVKQGGVKEDTAFYKNFIKPLAGDYSQGVKDYCKFLNDHYVDDHAKWENWNALFKKSCAMELAFWNASTQHKL